MNAADVEQLRHVAQDADGIPLSDEDLAFLASAEQDTLRIDDDGAVFVAGIGGVRHYPMHRVRAAIADARATWARTNFGARYAERPPVA
ncbi:hypothetical protein [Roseisolibacter agri]|uniref:hypothetical protein n=1 Tax=Roseisolibacter agri TaxID=2014610 RepID=UPI0024E0582A|nr:hypothetical protein [Roseisolibacter agri]